LPKLILLLFWVDLGPGYQKMAGGKFSDPSTHFWRGFSQNGGGRHIGFPEMLITSERIKLFM
jgi:hypothetical protein